MAALQDSAAPKRAGRGVGGEPKQKRARSPVVDAGGGGGSSAPATAPASASRAHPEGAAASLVDVTVEDADALDCVVCFLPLKPPIFQCKVGHLVCSLCRDKLQATGKCHVCGIATGSYHRCHGMERLVESICLPCSYAAHGYALRPAYCDQESHRLVCAHAPCHCPGNKNKGDTASVKCLLMLTVERQQLARFISVHWIDPHAAAASGSQGSSSKEMQCELSLYFYHLRNSRLMDHYQLSKFRVARTNLSNGLPKPDDCFQVVVANSVVRDGIDIQVKVKLKYIGVGQS